MMDLSPLPSPMASPVPRPAPCRSVALMIDGQNIAARLAPGVIRAARTLGPLSVSRVYGDARSLGPWHEVAGLRVVHAHAGKNVTDMLMAVEAMELSMTGQIDGFALATSDRDFTPLVQSLRQRGFPVLGLTGPDTPAMLRDSCTRTRPQPPPTAHRPDAPPDDPARASARALLTRASYRPQDFARAMQAAGHHLPPGHASWRAWAKAGFPGLLIRGQGQEMLLSLRA